jgi:lipopolysaccharide assembly outer membrane protein LptD (OstA)
VSIIRKGKTGKDRIDVVNVLIPTFFNEEMQENEKYIKTLPLGSKYYIHIKPLPMPNSLLSMSEIDLIGWSAAYVQYLKALIGHSSHGYSWPEEKSNPLNVVNGLHQRWDNDPIALLHLYASQEFKENLVNTVRSVEASLIKCLMAYQYNITHTIKAAAITIINNCKNYGPDLFDLNLLENVITFITKAESTDAWKEKLKMMKGYGDYV